jgi:hypothetical protein
MIANCSPCHLNYEDTHNTLKYASRAKNIKTKATRNVVSVNYHLSKYTEIIKELKGEIAELKEKLASAPDEVLPAGLSTPSAGEAPPAVEQAQEESELEMAHAQSTNWKQELMANFEERVRIKRQLIDLAHVAQNQMVQKSRAQVGISQWESTQVTSASPNAEDSRQDTDSPAASASASSAAGPSISSEMPQGIRDLQEQLQFIRTEMANTEETTRGLEQQLVENLRVAERLQVDLPTRVPNKDMRAFLGLVYRIYVLEVENIDLQEMNDVTQPLLQQKELEAEALRLQIRMRDRMIEEQDRLLALEYSEEEIPQRPAGWENIPSKHWRRSPSLSEALEEDDSPVKGVQSCRNADETRRIGPRSRRARSCSEERLGVQGVILPPLPAIRGGCAVQQERGRQDVSPPPPNISYAAGSHVTPPGAPPLGQGGLISSISPHSPSERVERLESGELPLLDIAGRGFGLASRLGSAGDACSPMAAPLNDITRPLAQGDINSIRQGLGLKLDNLSIVEGHSAMPSDWRRPMPTHDVKTPVQGNRERRSDTASRRKRKNRRERDAARAAHRERLQQQLHIEAAGLQQRYDIQTRGRDREQHVDLASDRGSSSDNTPAAHRNAKDASPAAPTHRDHPTAAGRRGDALKKMNQRMKVSPPKNLS